MVFMPPDFLVDSAGRATRVASSASPQTVLALGDSLYAGYGLPQRDSLPAQLEARLRGQGHDVRLVNEGVSGDTTAGGVRRLAPALARLTQLPDLVMLGLGANDALRLIPPPQVRANLKTMLELCRERGLRTLLTGMQVPEFLAPAYARAYNVIWPELAREYGAALDPFILAGVVGQRELLLADRIHPNARGVGIMADRLAPLVARLLGERRRAAA